jgi:DMSO reductase anchor subunit
MRVAKAVPQASWGLAAAANLILGGLGASLHLCALVAGAGRPDLPVAPALALAGFIIQGLETGRPRQGYLVLSRLTSGSWMSREAVLGGSFVIFGALDWLFGHPLLTLASAVSATGYLAAQGAMVAAARGVPSWNRNRVPLLLGSLSFMGGSGLLLLLKRTPSDQLYAPAILSLVVLAVDALLNLRSDSDGLGRRARALAFALAVHAIPAALILAGLAGGGRMLEGAAGLLMIGAGAWIKLRFIRKGMLRPLVLTTVETPGGRGTLPGGGAR